MTSPRGSRDDIKKSSTASSPGLLGVSKTIKKSRSSSSSKVDGKQIEDALKEDIAAAGEQKVNIVTSEGSTKDYSSEYNVKHPTDDPYRNKVRNILAKALLADNPKDETVPGRLTWPSMASLWAVRAAASREDPCPPRSGPRG